IPNPTASIMRPTLWRGAIPCCALVIAALFLASCTAHSEPADSQSVRDIRPSDYRIIAYVGGRTDIFRIGAHQLTHINYAFAQVNDDGEIYFRNERSPSHIAQLQALKARNPNLKILVSVGGWGADGFSDAALTDASRDVFSRSAIDMIEAYALDGIDIDWEFPGQPGPGIKFRPEDKRNFTLMLASLREHVDSLSDARGLTGDDRHLLTIASNDDQRFFDHTEMDRLHPYLDF